MKPEEQWSAPGFNILKRANDPLTIFLIKKKQPNARTVPMEPYGSAGQQATGLSSSKMASAMEEEWTQVTGRKIQTAGTSSWPHVHPHISPASAHSPKACKEI